MELKGGGNLSFGYGILTLGVRFISKNSIEEPKEMRFVFQSLFFSMYVPFVICEGNYGTDGVL